MGVEIDGGGGLNNIVEDTSPQLGAALDTNAFQINESKGADVASASALAVLGDGNSFDVTGTTTITSINTRGVGTHITLQFDGILTLTHNATDLILPGAANITTAAGDIAVFYEYATGDWRCVSYQIAANTPDAGGPTLDSEIVLRTANGYGSTNNKIRRWTTVEVNTGSDLTLTQSATDGDSITINTDGVYAVSLSDNYNAANDKGGITLNTAQPTVSISGLADLTEIVCIEFDRGTTSSFICCAATLRLSATDVLRAHTGGTVENSAGVCNFRVVRVG